MKLRKKGIDFRLSTVSTVAVAVAIDAAGKNDYTKRKIL